MTAHLNKERFSAWRWPKANGDPLMWPGFDQQIKRDLATIKTLVNLRAQTSTRDWPLIFVSEHEALLVVREWPGREITADTVSA
jgi:hypothetical protein